MAKRTLLKLFAFSDFKFAREDEANALVRELAGAPFGLTRFGRAEPLRDTLEADGAARAAKLLYGNGQFGAVMLGGKQPHSIFDIGWRNGMCKLWYAEFDARVADCAPHCMELAKTLERFFKAFPARYAAAAAAEVWKARHWLVRAQADGGENVKKVGLDLEHQLPGVYWWTLFGPDATRFFGRERLLALPCDAVTDLGAAGVACRADPCPQAHALGRPSPNEARLRDAIGAEYFFDITAPRRRGSGIPGVTVKWT
jgi:hypothetical protein